MGWCRKEPHYHTTVVHNTYHTQPRIKLGQTPDGPNFPTGLHDGQRRTARTDTVLLQRLDGVDRLQQGLDTGGRQGRAESGFQTIQPGGRCGTTATGGPSTVRRHGKRRGLLLLSPSIG